MQTLYSCKEYHVTVVHDRWSLFKRLWTKKYVRSRLHEIHFVQGLVQVNNGAFYRSLSSNCYLFLRCVYSKMSLLLTTIRYTRVRRESKVFLQVSGLNIVLSHVIFQHFTSGRLLFVWLTLLRTTTFLYSSTNPSHDSLIIVRPVNRSLVENYTLVS